MKSEEKSQSILLFLPELLYTVKSSADPSGVKADGYSVVICCGASNGKVTVIGDAVAAQNYYFND